MCLYYYSLFIGSNAVNQRSGYYLIRTIYFNHLLFAVWNYKQIMSNMHFHSPSIHLMSLYNIWTIWSREFEQFDVVFIDYIYIYIGIYSIYGNNSISLLFTFKRDKLLKDIVITVLQYKRFLSKDIKVEICGIFQNILQKIARLRLKYVQNSFNARIFCNLDLLGGFLHCWTRKLAYFLNGIRKN